MDMTFNEAVEYLKFNKENYEKFLVILDDLFF